MATRKPLVLVGGTAQELPAGDVLPEPDASRATALTAAAFAALAGSAGLVPDRIYRLTDTKQMAIATSASTYDLWSRAGEQGIVVSATAPASPYLNQIWVQMP